MSVHEAITKHSQRQHQALQTFITLDEQREYLIEEAIKKCQNGEFFSVDSINEVTRKIKHLAQKEIVPDRQYITEEMVKEYVAKLK